MSQLKVCPFCGKKLIHKAGKRVNRYYKGEPTMYMHYNPNCILDGIEICAKDIDKWNKRIVPKCPEGCPGTLSRYDF